MRARDCFAHRRVGFIVSVAAVALAILCSCARRLPVVNETPPNRTLSNRIEQKNSVPDQSELLLSKTERQKDVRFFTEIGRQFAAPARAIIVGIVKSANRLPSGPLIARIEVSHWLRTVHSGDETPRIIVVSDRTGSLAATSQFVFLFLDKPEGANDSIYPLLAAASGDPKTIEERSDWVKEDLRIAELEPYELRARETRDRILRMLQSKSSFERTSALRDTMLMIEQDDGIFAPGDASAFVRMAGQQRDRDYGLRLLDIAEMIRKRAPS